MIALLLAGAVALGDGTKIVPPKNSYSPADDVKVGREAAAQVSREMPLLPEDGEVDNYVESVGRTIVAAIPPEFTHPEFRYDFSVVNAADINAFALPGGPMFVNRGMIEAAHTEGEMAGVMAHEISHVALRHGTAQASKSQSPGITLGAIGGAILGAVIGGNAGDIVAQGTQIGLGTYLLKFSREYETQADILGAQILAQRRYDPMDLAKMFQTIEQKGGSTVGMDQQPPQSRQSYQRISDESTKLTIAASRRNELPDQFSNVQASLKRMAPAPSAEEIARSRKPDNNGRYPDDSQMGGAVERPSTQYRMLEVGGRVQINAPSNWKAFQDGSSVTLAPDGAYGNQKGQSVFTHGAIVGVTKAMSRDLNRESDQYVYGILNNYSYLKTNSLSQRSRIDNYDARRIRLSGTSPVTAKQEIVDVYTALTNRDELLHIVQVVPSSDQKDYRAAFDEMVRSMRVLN
jgi:hypothetical protein